MVVNHAGYALLAPDAATAGYAGALVFIGSMAPVLFFFATGVGMGLGEHRAGAVRDAAVKCAWLLLADLMLNTGLGRPLALNFLGFIGLSMLAVALIRATPRPLLTCVVLIAALLAVRYLPTPGNAWAGWDESVLAGFATGRHGTKGLAYPLSPWLVYPLAGFLLARCSVSTVGPLAAFTRAPVLLGLAVACLAAAAYAASRDASFLRWGTVAVAFFVTSLAVLALVWVVSRSAARVAARQPAVAAVASALSLRGSPSLLIVPIHYVLLASVEALGGQPVSPPAWLAITLAVGIVAWSLAKALPRWGAAWLPATKAARLAIVLAFAAAALGCWAVGAQGPALLVGAAGQAIVALALESRRRPANTVSARVPAEPGRTHPIIQGGTP